MKISQEELNIRITATNEANAALEEASSGLEKVELRAKQVAEESARTTVKVKDLAVGLSGVATASFSLYQSYDRLKDSQLTVNKAVIQAKSAAMAAEAAQRRYDAVLAKANSTAEERQAALEELRIAQERATLADERAVMLQENLRDSYMGFYISLLPTAITMTSAMSRTMEALGMSTSLSSGIASVARGVWAVLTGQMALSTAATHMMTAAQGALNAVMAINPIFLVVMALAALAAGLAWAYQNCEWFRNGVNWLWEQISVYLQPAIDAVTWAISNLGKVWDAVLGAMRWVWDHTIAPILDALNWVWNTLTGASASVSAGAPAEEVTNIPGFASGFEGVISKPTLMMVGEAGPEFVSITPAPAAAKQPRVSGPITVNGPLVYVEGSADEKTAKLAGEIVMRQLRRL